jgi:uncharacterized repeat protein (TIGR03803 family)
MKYSFRSFRAPCYLSESAHQRRDSYPFPASNAQPRRRISEMRMQGAWAALVIAAVLVPLIFSAQAAPAQTYSVLYSFHGPPDGKYPWTGLILDAAGNLYGTASRGGSSYWGTAFKLDSSGKETLLYNFLAGYGAYPVARLVQDAKGNLYGTTANGGAYNHGTVFKLDRKGNETVLHSFTGMKDGKDLDSGLILDAAGNLYGTTRFGGGTGCGGTGCGTVFKLNTSGKTTVLYSFSGMADGGIPHGGVIRDEAGNLYGTTEFGGNPACDCGTVFKIGKTGRLIILYSFTETGDLAIRHSGVIRDATGNLYGTTASGGDLSCDPPYGCGTVFTIDQAGKERVLYAFHGTGGDGTFPFAGVILDPAGDLYGTTWGGGTGVGTVFKLDKRGREIVLYSFSGGTDGSEPFGGVVQDQAGNLYGTTAYGGDLNCLPTFGCGVVFKLTP